MAWSVYRRTVADVVGAPPGLVLVCGLSIGDEDPSVPYASIDRAPLGETVTFVR